MYNEQKPRDNLKQRINCIPNIPAISDRYFLIIFSQNAKKLKASGGKKAESLETI